MAFLQTMALGRWTPPEAESICAGEAPVKRCDPDDHGCGAIVHASLRVCPECGREFPLKRKRSRTDDLQELTPKGPKLSREKRALHSYIRKAHSKGYLPNWAAMRFEEQFGCAPGDGFMAPCARREARRSGPRSVRDLSRIALQREGPSLVFGACLSRSRVRT